MIFELEARAEYFLRARPASVAAKVAGGGDLGCVANPRDSHAGRSPSVQCILPAAREGHRRRDGPVCTKIP